VNEFSGHRLGAHVVGARTEHVVPATRHSNWSARGHVVVAERGGHVDEKVPVVAEDACNLLQTLRESIIIRKIEDGVVATEHHIKGTLRQCSCHVTVDSRDGKSVVPSCELLEHGGRRVDADDFITCMAPRGDEGFDESSGADSQFQYSKTSMFASTPGDICDEVRIVKVGVPLVIHGREHFSVARSIGTHEDSSARDVPVMGIGSLDNVGDLRTKADGEGYVYLDHAATSPLRPEAREAMDPFHDVVFANPSGSHRFSRVARRAIDEARDVVAEVIGCRPGEVVFTSGGTEGANSAVFGAVRRHGGVAVCSAAEHHAVLHCVEHVGGRVLPVSTTGALDATLVRETLHGDDGTSVVSVMAVNNEVGVVSDMVEISRAVRRRAPQAILHTDAVQAACWLDLHEIWPHVDVMTLSAHKFGGPKGIGMMAVREGVSLEPLIHGGGQERDRRSGTHNVAGIVGATAALAVTHVQRPEELVRIGKLRDALVSGLLGAVEGCSLTVDAQLVVPGIVHVCIEGIENEALLFLLDEHGLCASAASACASGAMEPSHVLAAMNVSKSRSMGALRLSLGHTTTQQDVDDAVRIVTDAASTLRSRSSAAGAR